MICIDGLTITNLYVIEIRQFMYFTSKFKSSPKSVSINLESTVLHPTNTIRNLGVVWDHHLIIRSQMSRVCSSVAFSLNNIHCSDKSVRIT